MRDTVKNLWAHRPLSPVTFKDYATQPFGTVGAEHGLADDGELRLWGNFEMGPSGLITGYDEYFVP